MPFSQAIVIEVFCGKAQLSRKLRQRGFQVFSVDHVTLKGVPIMSIDLNSTQGQTLFFQLLSAANLFYVHFAPPCGTASAARNIRMGQKHGPPPLRSLRFPMGLPSVKQWQSKRVSLANSLYRMTCKAVIMLQKRHIGWSIENPASSLMWLTQPFCDLMARFGDQIIGVSFHTCMFQAPRKKTTALWTNVPSLKTAACAV